MTSITLNDDERQPCEVWSRCMGYHRPITFWNAGKQAEHRDRVQFKERVAMKRVADIERGNVVFIKQSQLRDTKPAPKPTFQSFNALPEFAIRAHG